MHQDLLNAIIIRAENGNAGAITEWGKIKTEVRDKRMKCLLTIAK